MAISKNMSFATKIKIKLILVLTTISVWQLSFSGTIGYPYIINFFNPTKDFLASDVKDFTFLPNGEIIGATDAGIVLFDGGNWYKLFDGYFLSVAYDSVSNRVYVGSDASFGYLSFNSVFNSFEYTKLSLLVPERVKNVWYIIPSRYGIYFFVNGTSLYLYDYTGVIKVKVPKGFRVNRGFLVNNSLYVMDDSSGIGKVVKDKFVKITSDSREIYSHSIRVFLPDKGSDDFLLVTKDGLIYKYNELEEKFSFVADLSGRIKDVEIYGGNYLSDSLLILNTLNSGVLIINKKGEIKEHLLRGNGLGSDKVSKVRIDPNRKVVFLGTGRFFDALLYFYPFRNCNEDNSGFIGDIGDYKILGQNLFIGTDNGLFVCNIRGEPKFRLLNKKLIFYRPTMVVMHMPDGRDFIIGGSLRHLFAVSNDLKVRILANYYNLYSLRQSHTNPYRFYALSFDSLFVFRFNPEKITVRKEFSFPLLKVYKQLELNARDSILLISFNNSLLDRASVDFKNRKLTITPVTSSYLNKKIRVYQDSLFFVLTNKGLFRLDEYSNSLVPFDPDLDNRLSQIEKNSPLLDFFFYDKRIIFLSPQFLYVYHRKDGTISKYSLIDKFWVYPRDLSFYGNTLIFNKIYSLVFVDIKNLDRFRLILNERPILSLVQLGDYTFYDFLSPSFLSHRDTVYKLEIPIPYNTAIGFRFNLVNSLITDDVKYSYYLKRYSKNWSSWRSGELRFNGLMPGKYLLKVRVLSNVTGRVYNLAVYFRVKPPFYLSRVALGLYIFLLALFVYAVVRLRLHREEIVRSRLERLVKKRTAELEQKTRILQESNKMLNMLTEELKSSREELVAQNEKLRLTNLELRQLSLVAQYTNNAVLILDDKGRIEWWNKEFANLFKYKFKKGKETYIPRNIKQLRPDIFERILNFDPDFKSVTYTTHEIIPDTGEDIWYQTTITAVKDETGKIFRFVILDIDITESKLAEREIKLQRDKLKDQTEVLQKVNRELEESRKNLERQHQEMLSSLEYAKRLQKALLPDELLHKLFPESFIFYMPKEIVSGDFYYLDKRGDKIVFALGDATGHGVPGAFMSVLGITLLKDAIEKNEDNLLPNRILETLRNSVIKALHRNVIFSDIKDGLDIGLNVIDIKEKKLYFAGANISVNIIRDRDILIEIRADRMAIGIKELAKLPFNLEVTDIFDGDRLYLYTDGFIDQFGGQDNKRYKRTRFKNFILKIQDIPLSQQEEVFRDELDKWMNDNEQIDDILIVGVELDFEYLQTMETQID